MTDDADFVVISSPGSMATQKACTMFIKSS